MLIQECFHGVWSDATVIKVAVTPASFNTTALEQNHHWERECNAAFILVSVADLALLSQPLRCLSARFSIVQHADRFSLVLASACRVKSALNRHNG